MSITVNWYDEKHTAVVNKLVGSWTWDELFRAIDQTAALMDTVDYPVNIVLDMRQTQHVPTLLPSALRKVANAPTMNHRNSGAFIFVGAKAFIKSMFSIFSTLYPRAAEKYRFAETEAQLEAALAAKSN